MQKQFLIIVILGISINSQSQTFYFSTKKEVIKENKSQKRELKNKQNIDLSIPLDFIWLKDSIFIADEEVTLGEWAINYVYQFDTSFKKSEEISKILDYNVDSIYKTKSFDAYKDLRINSVLLYTNYLSRSKVERPLVFIDSVEISKYVGYLNAEVNRIIQLEPGHWFWSKYFDKKYEVKYELLTLDDYLLALKIHKKISPEIRISDSLPENIPVPIEIYKNYQNGEKVIGLTGNASEIIIFKNLHYVVYKVDEKYIYISRFNKPDYHIGFRLKCNIKLKGT
jgi:hypothetical protein